MREKTLKCDQCDKKFTRKDSLQKHIKKKHEFKKVLSCKSCEKHFQTNFELTTHLKIFHKRKTHDCEKCGKAFPSRSGKSNHKSFVNCKPDESPKSQKEKVKDQKYDICNKAFNAKANLKRHLKNVHENEVKVISEAANKQGSTANDENAKIAMIKFAKRNKIVPWIEQPTKGDKKVDKVLSKCMVAKQSEVVEDEEMTNFSDEEKDGENSRIDTSLKSTLPNTKTNTNDSEKDLQNENESLRAEANYWKTKYESLNPLKKEVETMKMQIQELQKLQLLLQKDHPQHIEPKDSLNSKFEHENVEVKIEIIEELTGFEYKV